MDAYRQKRIWDYYQNEQKEVFYGNTARLSFLAKMVSRQKVLNIGVGNGAFEELALKNGADVFTLDPSEDAIEKIRLRLNLDEKAKVGYCQDIPFPDEHFDAVIISEVLEHLDETTLLKTLNEIFRVLKDRGRLIGTVPSNENLDTQRIVCPECGTKFHRWGHVQSFSLKRLNILLRQYFIVEEIYSRPFIRYPVLNRKGKINVTIIRWFLRLYLKCVGQSISENLVFVASKRCS